MTLKHYFAAIFSFIIIVCPTDETSHSDMFC
jgi:hypothetical protein